jgi:antitoxin (DNA-binding transcriptional repressor) of toxin-antitoxin stability system
METTVLKAKNQLSELLRRAELGEEVIIRRGAGGKAFRLAPVEPAPQRRTLDPDPAWSGRIAYRDEDLFESEWRDDQ